MSNQTEGKAQEQKPMDFPEYKARLKKEVELAELRARLAVAQFTELDASSRYNSMIEQIRATIKEEAIPVSQSAQTHAAINEALQGLSEEAGNIVGEPYNQPDMFVEQP